MRQQSQYLQQNMQTSPQTIILLQSLRLPNLFIRFDIYNHSRSTIQLYIYNICMVTVYKRSLHSANHVYRKQIGILKVTLLATES